MTTNTAPRNLGWITALAVMGAVALLTGALVMGVFKSSDDASRRRSAEAAPVGLAALPTRWSNGEDDEEGHTLTFSFVDAQNEVHTQTLEQVTWWDARASWKVCYNPEKPGDHDLYPADHRCGS